MKQKKLGIVLLIAVFVLPVMNLLASGTSARTTTAAQTEVKILTWTPIPRTMEKMIAAFQEKNPDVKVTFNNMNYNPQYLAALSAGAGSNSLPDIIALQPGALTQQYRNYLIDLTPYMVKSWGNNWADKFYKIDSDQMQLGNPVGDNSVYIAPCESQIIDIWYNKSLFEQLGIKVPVTWDELKAASKTLSERGYAPLYFGGADGWQKINLFLMLSEQLAPGEVYTAQENKSQWTSAGMVKVMEAWKDFYTNVAQVGSLSNLAYPDGVGQFVAGRVGMMALGSWWPQEFTAPDTPPTVKNWVFDHFFLPPYSPGGQASPPIGGMDFGFGITKNSKNPEAAWRVLESFTAGDGIQASVDDLNNLPAVKGIAPQATNIPQSIKEQISRYNAVLDQARNQRFSNPEVETALQNAMDGVATGQLTPQAALRQVQEVQDRVSR
ncbi:MAG: ABC transporter substrate-binding protein [Spirochaetaceae bacterium]|jgi:raffinose/stachyose/melibiose transport system substrate-binding protein|nr:ABC transporter substrate-binding protein [Spirochaetaceae bacterium]